MSSKTIVKRFLSFSVGSWINAVISLIGIPIISRFIDPEEYGKASMFTLAVSLLQCVFVLGVDQSFARFYNETDEEKRKQLFRDALLPVIALCLAGIVGLLLFRRPISVILFGSPDFILETNILGISILVVSLIRMGLLSLRMQNKAKQYSFLQIVNALTTLVCTIAYARFVSRSFTAIIVGFAVSQLMVLILSVWFDRATWAELFRGRLDVNTPRIRILLLYGLPFIPTFIVDWFFQGIDRTFLRVYSNYAELGLYASAVKISMSLSILQTGFTTFWIPFAYERYTKTPDDRAFYGRFFNVLTFAFGVLIAGILLFDNILIQLFPPIYHDIKYIFPFLLFVPMLYTLSEVTVVGINYNKRTINHLYIAIGASLMNAVAAYLLVPAYGARGAAIATFVAYIVFFVLRTSISLKYYSVPYDFRKFGVTMLIMSGFALAKLVFTNGYVNLASIPCIMLLTLMYKSDILKFKHIYR